MRRSRSAGAASCVSTISIALSTSSATSTSPCSHAWSKAAKSLSLRRRGSDLAEGALMRRDDSLTLLTEGCLETRRDPGRQPRLSGSHKAGHDDVEGGCSEEAQPISLDRSRQ